MAISAVPKSTPAPSQLQSSTELRVRSVLVNSIRIGKRMRPISDISSLIESIREVGLLNPISVSRDKWLISGLHRLEAFKTLGRRHIPAFILSVSPQEARIAEIDENLARNDLSLLDRAEHIYRRKQLYEELHPERRHGGNRGNQYTGGKKCQDANLQFCQTAAVVCRQSSTTVYRLVRIARLLTAETKQRLRGTGWANNQEILMKLCKLTPDMQHDVAGKVANGESNQISDALAKVHRDRLRAMGCVVPLERQDCIVDVNLLASNLLREIESAVKEWKLKRVVESRTRLNPTIRRQLISTLKNAATTVVKVEQQLSKDFHEFPTNGKAYQRKIREQMALTPEPDEHLKREAASSFANAEVREITKEQAAGIILKYEWLGNLGCSDFAFGLFCKHPVTGMEYHAGVACFGRTAGSNVTRSICGEEYAERAIILVRGACVHWSHKHSASWLITRACELMVAKGYNIFIGYSDESAGEVGTIYQSCGWTYFGKTKARTKYRTPDGKIRDDRQVHGLTRDRAGGTMKYKRTRAEQKELLLKEGCEFFNDDGRKHRYVGFYGNKRDKRMLRRALKWEMLPYPKRQQISDVTIETQQTGFGLPIPHPHSQENLHPGA
jgi:hypothetical protein